MPFRKVFRKADTLERMLPFDQLIVFFNPLFLSQIGLFLITAKINSRINILRLIKKMKLFNLVFLFS